MKKYGIFILVLMLISCKEPDRKPAGLLSEAEMVQVLSELYLAEAKVNYQNLSPDSAQKLFAGLEGKIFEATGVPDTVFKNSLDYYMQQPEGMEKIYGVVVDTLQLREQRAPYRPDQR